MPLLTSSRFTVPRLYAYRSVMKEPTMPPSDDPPPTKPKSRLACLGS